MMAKTGTWVYRNGKLVPKHKAATRINRHGSAPNVISDSLGTHLRHMGTGQYLDSKSAFRNADKACGAVCVGNETSAKPRKLIEMPSAGHDIKRAIHQLRNQ
jgi:hypothetical protein